ncbi:MULTISPECIES: hypothetical protein [Streptomyces]|uniref:hypothetical protein n=1 Tax=Streptomyces TaxID=1883 RepID=UPI0029309561|nr:hypothetical protein [Streptomyces sp. NEAU-HV9]
MAGLAGALITGGDPLVTSTDALRRYVEPLLEIDTIRSVRIGTKSLALRPYRFTADRDADDLLRLFEQVVASGRILALMAHFTYPKELRPPVVREAPRRVRDTGPQGCFGVPRARGHATFRDAHARVSGLARTVRGPDLVDRSSRPTARARPVHGPETRVRGRPVPAGARGGLTTVRCRRAPVPSPPSHAPTAAGA